MSKYFQAYKLALKGYALYLAISVFACILVVYGGIKIPGYQIPAPIFGATVPAIIAVGVIMVIILPVIEEIIFRKFLLQLLTDKVGNMRGSIITAMLFASVNSIHRGFIPVFILGLILNWVFMRSKSIWPCIWLHVINNAVIFTLEILLVKGVIPLDF